LTPQLSGLLTLLSELPFDFSQLTIRPVPVIYMKLSGLLTLLSELPFDFSQITIHPMHVICINVSLQFFWSCNHWKLRFFHHLFPDFMLTVDPVDIFE
jgi:hypothetical protein